MVFTKGTKVTTGPATEPVTTADAKLWLKVDFATDNDLIDALVASARSYIESATGIAMYTQTVQDVLDGWPDYEPVTNPFRAFHLLRYPVQSVTSITYVDGDGTTQTLDSSKYIVDTTGTYCRIAPAAGESWPGLRTRITPITVTYTAGYSAVASIPADLVTAVKLWMTANYERRGDRAQQYRSAVEDIISKHYVHI